MLNIYELQKLLKQNERLQLLENARIGGASTKRIFELQLHRTLIKDCIIQLLESGHKLVA